MPENLSIAAFVFGAVLLLIALLGGSFKLFGAEITGTTVNRSLRTIAAILGGVFMVIALYPKSSPGIDEARIEPTLTPTTAPTIAPPPQDRGGNAPASNAPAGNAPPQGGCALRLTNGLVDLVSKPENLSQPLMRVPPGEYVSLGRTVTNFGGLKDEGWFQIEVSGQKGWIKDDTWTIDDMKGNCR